MRTLFVIDSVRKHKNGENVLQKYSFKRLRQIWFVTNITINVLFIIELIFNTIITKRPETAGTCHHFHQINFLSKYS